MSVNGLIGILTLPHSGMTISMTKSSIAIYNTSSIFGFSLWISSMNRISQVSSVFNILIISDGLVIAYQVTALIFTCPCLEIICAMVVFPNPLGPENKIWPICHFLIFPLSIAVFTIVLICSCPINSSNVSGLHVWLIFKSLSVLIFFISIFHA